MDGEIEEIDDGQEQTERQRLFEMSLLALINEYETSTEDRRASICYILRERLGITKEVDNALGYARADIRDLERRLADDGGFVNWFFGSERLRLLGGYLQIAPLHVWKRIRVYMLGDRPFGRFGNERCSSQKGGARWGGYLYGVEIGSRNPDDVVGGWLKKRGLWPW